jgi:hypothetical protein
MMHGFRKLNVEHGYKSDLASNNYEHREADYVDACAVKTYEMDEQTFRDIQDAQELQKLQRINQQLETILANKNVSDKRLRATLTAEEYTEYTASLENVSHPAEITYGDGMPSVLHSYTAILRQADFQNNKYEKMNGLKSVGRKKYSSSSLTAVSNKAESLYELALERLGEIWSSATPTEQYELQTWMDREIDFDKGFNSTLSIDCVGIPRVRGSRSINALDSGLPKLSKRLKRKECQLQALRSAACVIAFEPEQEPEYATNPVVSAKLRALLRRNDDDDLI